MLLLLLMLHALPQTCQQTSMQQFLLLLLRYLLLHLQPQHMHLTIAQLASIALPHGLPYELPYELLQYLDVCHGHVHFNVVMTRTTFGMRLFDTWPFN